MFDPITVLVFTFSGVSLYLIAGILVTRPKQIRTMDTSDNWKASALPMSTEPMRMSALAGELGVEPGQVKEFLEDKGFRIKEDPPLSDSIVSMVRAALGV